MPRMSALRWRPETQRVAPAELVNDVVQVQHAPRAGECVTLAIDQRHVAQDVHRVEQGNHLRLDFGPLPGDLDRGAVVERRPDLLARSQSGACIVHPNAASHLTQFMGGHFELVYSLDDRLAGHQLPSCHLHSDLLSFCMLGSVRSQGRCRSYQP